MPDFSEHDGVLWVASADYERLRALLRDASILISRHHDATNMRIGGWCPHCAKDGALRPEVAAIHIAAEEDARDT